jgi:transcriptional repressor NrdR
MVINKLRALDSVAYMRFASVYKDFKNLGNFEKELKTLKK